MNTLLLSLALLLIPVQSQPSAAGHWEGNIAVPGTPIQIVIDLARGKEGFWRGTLGVPSQGGQDLPLLNLTVDAGTVSFDMPGAPGYPSMKGKVSADGKAITGELVQAGHNLPFQLERKGETKLTADAKTPGPVGELKGEWEGALNAGGQTLRLKFKIAPSQEGSLAGVLDSIDQQVFIPIDSATEQAGSVNLVLNLIGGAFKGKLVADKKSIEGTWEQNGNSLPLTLTRPAPVATPK